MPSLLTWCGLFLTFIWCEYRVVIKAWSTKSNLLAILCPVSCVCCSHGQRLSMPCFRFGSTSSAVSVYSQRSSCQQGSRPSTFSCFPHQVLHCSRSIRLLVYIWPDISLFQHAASTDTRAQWQPSAAVCKFSLSYRKYRVSELFCDRTVEGECNHHDCASLTFMLLFWITKQRLMLC